MGEDRKDREDDTSRAEGKMVIGQEGKTEEEKSVGKGKQAVKEGDRTFGGGYDEDEDEDEEDFDVGEDDDDEDDDDDDDDDRDDEEVGEHEVEDLQDEQGPSSAEKRKRSDEDDIKILEGLSGDEVDPSNIIEGGRGSRRRRGGSSGAGVQKYSAKAQVDSDEDSW